MNIKSASLGILSLFAAAWSENTVTLSVHPMVSLYYASREMPVVSLGYQWEWGDKWSLQGNITAGIGNLTEEVCHDTSDSDILSFDLDLSCDNGVNVTHPGTGSLLNLDLGIHIAISEYGYIRPSIWYYQAQSEYDDDQIEDWKSYSDYTWEEERGIMLFGGYEIKEWGLNDRMRFYMELGMGYGTVTKQWGREWDRKPKQDFMYGSNLGFGYMF